MSVIEIKQVLQLLVIEVLQLPISLEASRRIQNLNVFAETSNLSRDQTKTLQQEQMS